MYLIQGGVTFMAQISMVLGSQGFCHQEPVYVRGVIKISGTTATVELCSATMVQSFSASNARRRYSLNIFSEYSTLHSCTLGEDLSQAYSRLKQGVEKVSITMHLPQERLEASVEALFEGMVECAALVAQREFDRMDRALSSFEVHRGCCSFNRDELLGKDFKQRYGVPHDTTYRLKAEEIGS